MAAVNTVVLAAVGDGNLLTELTLGQILGMAATLVIIVGLWRMVHPITKRLNDLMDDWFGQKSRPGVPERKGVMERLSDQDSALKRIDVENHDGNHKEVLRRLDIITGTSHVNGQHLNRVERLLLRHIRESKSWVEEVDKAAAAVEFKMPQWPNIPDPDIEEQANEERNRDG